MNGLKGKTLTIPTPTEALPGRNTVMPVGRHQVSNISLSEPYPPEFERVVFGMGCFWGAERKFWSIEGVYVTAVGYSAGHTPNPSYEEVCSGMTGHNEVVLVVYNPSVVPFESLLEVFWSSHDPTQGMGQGNDRGTQYRSGIYYFNDNQKLSAETSQARYQAQLTSGNLGIITTEISKAGNFYFAEHYHQQYLAKNPNGYCGLGGTGISYSCN